MTYRDAASGLAARVAEARRLHALALAAHGDALVDVMARRAGRIALGAGALVVTAVALALWAFDLVCLAPAVAIASPLLALGIAGLARSGSRGQRMRALALAPSASIDEIAGAHPRQTAARLGGNELPSLAWPLLFILPVAVAALAVVALIAGADSLAGSSSWFTPALSGLFVGTIFLAQGAARGLVHRRGWPLIVTGLAIIMAGLVVPVAAAGSGWDGFAMLVAGITTLPVVLIMMVMMAVARGRLRHMLGRERAALAEVAAATDPA